MLRALHLQGVGPAPRFDVEFADRLNVLTGDNGLGKSFLLDVAWWSLTGTWPGMPAAPRKDAKRRKISWTTLTGTGGKEYTNSSDFAPKWQKWSWHPILAPGTGLTVYARVDGGFSVWDPVRNDDGFKQAAAEASHRPSAFHFSPAELWDGLSYEGKSVCNGLIRDWVSWQLMDDGSPQSPFQMLLRVLKGLSPSTGEPIKPGRPTRISVEDVRDYPTIDMPYGNIPVVHASAAMKRILGLAYLIVWTWHEHVQASGLLGMKPDNRFVLLIDELETHLHPQWQRRIVRALVEVIEGLARKMSVQAILTTHSPLVLASLEPFFDEARDALFLFELKGQQVNLRQLLWAKQGDANDWLTSEIFRLEQPRSLEAERVIEAAEAFMRGELGALPEGLSTQARIHAELQRLLPEQDPFWPRWIVAREKGGRRGSLHSSRRAR
ncbi:AAA family ATPase [Archangium violaceum]|uniref:AAA family ATPase n=1 Tax=Archangium violaceum TaxID=83451 RepID=UPI0036DE29EA